MNIVVLNTGLFPDRKTMEDALSELEAVHSVYRCDATGVPKSDEEWNKVLDALLASDVVVTL
ncbi:MAG: hypothetical protein ACYDHM_12190 [Acidiferrobacterales bacterium]